MTEKNQSQSRAQERKESDKGRQSEKKTGFGNKKLEGPDRPST